MPLYEYRCRACGTRFERIRKFSDPPLSECPSCGGEVEKLLSAPAIQFKGAGWYITDYARKGDSADSKAKADEGGKGAGSADADKSKTPAASGASESSESSRKDAGSKGDSAAPAPAAPAKSKD